MIVSGIERKMSNLVLQPEQMSPKGSRNYAQEDHVVAKTQMIPFKKVNHNQSTTEVTRQSVPLSHLHSKNESSRLHSQLIDPEEQIDAAKSVFEVSRQRLNPD